MSGTVVIDDGSPQKKVKQEDDVNLTCSAKGGPGNSINWTLNGEAIIETGVLFITTVVMDSFSISTLRISSIDAKDHQGTYQCTVINTVGSDNASVEIVGELRKVFKRLKNHVT